MKIGLIADTHMPGSIDALWPHAMAAFDGVHCILHAGDLHTLEIVDRLSEIAPTYVARGNGDQGIVDDRLRDCWLLEFGGVQVGLIHQFPSPFRKSADHLSNHLYKHFGDNTPDVVIYGHTHLEDVRTVEQRLYINPGSPTLPRNQSLRFGTIGYLEIDENHVTGTVLQLTETGVTDHDELQPLKHPR